MSDDPNSPCLTDDGVLDFVAGRLEGAARATVERHLGHCLLCNRLVAVAAGYQGSAPANDLRNVYDAVTDGGDTRIITGEETGGALPLGTLLRGTHRLERLVGRGGMGEVFEASHTRLPGRFAVKVLHPHCVADPKAIIRFRREAEITSALRHPNIVAIIDFDYTPAGAPYLVMEYLDGGELARVIADEAPLALDRVLRIVDQIASALTAVHRRDIVHRDLKPQNVFLVRGERAGEEHVKLCDFGISKVRAASVALTGERVMLGTPQYMAPEQARGLGEVDARADQFALAAIVYEMLTGRLAFPGDRVEIVVYRITHEDPAPLGPPWGPALAAALGRALSKDPASRFATVQDFAAALHAAAAADRPAGAPLVTPGHTTMRHVAAPAAVVTPATNPPAAVTGARRRTVAGGLGALAVVALGVGAALLARSPKETVPGAPATAVPATPPPASSHAFAPLAPAPAAPEPPATAAAPEAARASPPRKAPAAVRSSRADEDAPAKTPVRDSKRGSLIDRL